MKRQLGVLFLAGCGCTSASSPSGTGEDRGERLIERAVEAHRARKLASATVEFSFRDVPYRMTRDAGRFRYERWPAPGRREVLTNRGFTLYIHGRPAKLSPVAAAARSRSLNSVVYFASLPYVLLDPAVRARAVGPQGVGGRALDVVEVRFVAEGGGEDHDDVFRYWFDPETGELAYLAYSFTRGQGGVRFRERTGVVVSEGVKLVNWANFGLPDPSVDLASLPELWSRGELPRLSNVELEDVEVSSAWFDSDPRGPQIHREPPGGRPETTGR